jgi:hypothetical protein
MHTKLIAVAAIVVAATALTGLATAGGATTQQQVAFTYTNNDPSKMMLAPLTSGSIQPDHGATSWCCWTQRTVRQDGEQLEVNNPLATFAGAHGTLTWRERITWLDLPSGYSIATGTWRIVSGTGAYAHVTGHGHLALVSRTGDTALTYRAVGLVAGG